MKMPIAWHERCLTAMRSSLANYRANIEQLQERASRLEKECLIREAQISEARRLGKDSFDPDKFLVKRKTVDAKEGAKK